MSGQSNYIQGVGAQINPNNRFHQLSKGDDFEDFDPTEEPLEKTRFIEVNPKSIVNKVPNGSKELYYSMNPYQGCEHGCTYCYARPSHEYWGYSAGTDFERVILVKKNAPELLEQTFRKKLWKVQPITLSGNTDCYQPCERNFGITRKLLEVFLEYRHPVSIITKNTLLTRDIPILSELAKLDLLMVYVSLTTLKEELRRRLEPRTASCLKKLSLIEQLTNEGIPVHVLMAPIIPGLNDDEIFSVGKAVAERGALSMHHQIVKLEGPNGAIFTDWVTKNYPDRATKVINFLKDVHGGELSSSIASLKKRGEGKYAENIRMQMELVRKRFFKSRQLLTLRTDLFRIPDKNGQMSLF